MYVPVPLKANEWTRLPYPGRFMLLKTISGSKEVDIEVEYGRQVRSAYGTMRANGSVRSIEQPFTGLRMKAGADCIVGLIVDDNIVELNFGEDRVTTAYNVGPTNVNTVSTLLVGADENRLSIAFYNQETSANAVAIIPPGSDWNARSVVLQPGDTVEFSSADGAALAWHGICGVGTATVGMKALYA